MFGDSASALIEPDSIAISESFARVFFGSSNPINKMLSTDASQYRVTAVFRDLPPNTHLKYDVLMSRNLLERDSQAFIEQATPMNLVGTYIYTYFKLADASQIDDFATQINNYANDYAGAALAEMNMELEYFVQPLTSIHYDNRWMADQPTGKLFYLYGLCAIAIFISLIACINYTNVSIARAIARRDELTMHKILGAKRSQLTQSFLIESLLHVMGALVIVMASIELARLMPELNALIEYYSSSGLLLVLILITLIMGLLAGAYPAYYLGAHSIASQGRLAVSKVGAKFTTQKLLIVTQFTVSIAILLSTVLMSLQMQYVAKKPLGFEPNNRIMIDLIGGDVIDQLSALRQELLADPSILSVAEASQRLDSGRQGVPNYMFDIENHEGATESIGLVQYEIGLDYLTLMGVDLTAGRDFRADEQDRSLIVNQALVRRMGWTNPIGKRIGDRQQVVGVVRDFHLDSLHGEIAPLILQLWESPDFSQLSPRARSNLRQVLYVQLAQDSIAQGLTHVGNVLSKFQPQQPFQYTFFTDALDEYYSSDRSLVLTAAVFAAIGILISCLGMFCITALNMQQSVKEIGIRRVLGATAWQIAKLFVGRQVLLVLAGGLAASLISYYAISDWLASFAYRVEISFWIFPSVVTLVAFFSMSIIAFQAFTASRVSPVKTLRYE